MRFTVLGPVTVVVSGASHSLTRARTRGLLGLLALNAGRWVAVEAIDEALWGGASPSTARTQLQMAVSVIRRQLADLGEPDVIGGGTFGYRLAVRPEQVDAATFESLVRRAGDLSAENPAGAADLLRDALALWQGEPLADASGSFVDGVRARLTGQKLAALEALARIELTLDRPAQVVAALAPVVAEHPLDEPLRARLVEALARSGRQVEALQSLHSYRALLADEVGLDPGDELRRIELAILRGEAYPQPAAAVPVGVPRREPAAPVPAQLPSRVANFAGRVAQLRQLDELARGGWEHGTSRLVAVTGTAGVGKTALAVHWAQHVRHRYPDGQLYVDLRGFSPGARPLRPIEALTRFLLALGVTGDQVPVDPDRAGDLYRSLLAERRMLILLDNTRDPGQARPLLPGGEHCLVLITSRDQLSGLVARDGLGRVDLDMLTSAESGTLLTSIIGADRAALRPAAVAELARLCAGLPLALRIAATQLADERGRDLADFTAALARAGSVAALAVAGDPHAAVRTAFEQSYQAQPVPLRRMFALLGLAPGVDIASAAAAALAGVPAAEAGRTLARLVGGNLVTSPGPGRYALHDLLRQYAAERAHAEFDRADTDAALSRLYAHYLATTDTAAQLLYPQMLRLPDRLRPPLPAAGVPLPDAAAAAGWLDTERDNLIAAVIRAATDGPRPMAWRLSDALRGYFATRDLALDWESTVRAAQSAAEADDEPVALAAAGLSLGLCLQRSYRHPAAVTVWTEALALARAGGWDDGEAGLLGNLGAIHHFAGELDRAIEYYRQAQAAFERTGHLGGQNVAFGNLAGISVVAGRLTEAVGYARRCVAMAEQTGAQALQARGQVVLATALLGLGELDEALAQASAADELQRGHGDAPSDRGLLGTLALIHAAAGRLRPARSCADRLLALCQGVVDDAETAFALQISGEVRLAMGEPQRAVADLARALELAFNTPNLHLQAGVLGPYATALRVAGDPRAAEIAQRLSTLATGCGYRVLIGDAELELAQLALDRGDHAQARTHARTALEIHTGTGQLVGLRRARDLLTAADPAASRR